MAGVAQQQVRVMQLCAGGGALFKMSQAAVLVVSKVTIQLWGVIYERMRWW